MSGVNDLYLPIWHAIQLLFLSVCCGLIVGFVRLTVRIEGATRNLKPAATAVPSSSWDRVVARFRRAS